ncbi:hypothetical protein ACPV3A_33795 [Paenibacillus sp. Dod16]|uniref:hypothetical protein n=1 Tax=unclassified Paenibacillus TaxID=185978 RepID=UPI0035C1DD4C
MTLVHPACDNITYYPQLFTEAAMDEIYSYSSGAARLVNKLCTHALIYGAQNKHRIVDDQMVKRVIQGELS